MKFNGVIQKVLPLRSGISERTGKEWATQGFIFEYKENATDRSPDRVILETFDANIIARFNELMEKGEDGNPIIENATIRLKQPLYVNIGFSHKTRVFTNKQGQQGIMNDLGIYDFVWLKQPQMPPQPSNSPQPQQNANSGQASAPFPPQVDANGNPINQNGDDLPF
jgi:hypothetical protein